VKENIDRREVRITELRGDPLPDLGVPSPNRLAWTQSSWIWGYCVAVFSLAAAMIISRWLTPHIGFPGTLFLCVVMLSGWYGGIGPGLLATVLSTLAFHYSFPHPIHVGPGIPREMPRLLLFLVSNILIAFLSAAQRKAKESIRRARDELKRTVQDLQKTNEALHAESRERVRTAEALRQTQADLARVNRVTSMGELTASLAHEVNQPIAAAMTDAGTCLRWLSRDQPDLEEARAAASRLMEDGKRANAIVDRVRRLFKKDAVQRELVDVNEIIREMFLLLHGEATQYGILLRKQLTGNLPRVTGDRVQLQQVLMNLMMNAIDAMKDVDGTRELTLQSQRGEDGEVRISVSDTGVGLPPEQTDQIFNAFFTTKPHGTGMGLRISRSIVESHGGRLWADGNASRGASFHLTLPTRIEVPQE
jgi:C4-dicarboxylate-specific signal transduction histidine kinase